MERVSISIIGVGNLLMADEGFGCHFVRYLEERFVFSKEVRLVDAGTAGIYMAPVLESCDHAIFVDVMFLDNRSPGDIIFCSLDELTSKNLQLSMSPHQIGVLEVIEICRLRGMLPKTIEFFAVVPSRVEPGVGLSSELKAAITKVAERVVSRVREKGVKVRIA